MAHELPVESLRLRCDPQTLPCTTSEELRPGKAIIGQLRATRSLQFGLDIQAPGLGRMASPAAARGQGRAMPMPRRKGRARATPTPWE